MALLQLLLEQPAGRDNLVRLIRKWPDQYTDPMVALTRSFPALGEGSANVQKWWTLNLARFAAADRYKGLSIEASDKELNALLDIELVLNKAGQKKTFNVAEFDLYLKLKGAREALKARHDSVVGLSARANAL